MLADAALSGANMNMAVVERKVKAAIAMSAIPEGYALVPIEVGEAFDRLERACYELDHHAEEYDFDDGSGRGASQSFWDDLTRALEAVTEARDEAAKEVQS